MGEEEFHLVGGEQVLARHLEVGYGLSGHGVTDSIGITVGTYYHGRAVVRMLVQQFCGKGGDIFYLLVDGPGGDYPQVISCGLNFPVGGWQEVGFYVQCLGGIVVEDIQQVTR